MCSKIILSFYIFIQFNLLPNLFISIVKWRITIKAETENKYIQQIA